MYAFEALYDFFVPFGLFGVVDLFLFFNENNDSKSLPGNIFPGIFTGVLFDKASDDVVLLEIELLELSFPTVIFQVILFVFSLLLLGSTGVVTRHPPNIGNKRQLCAIGENFLKLGLGH